MAFRPACAIPLLALAISSFMPAIALSVESRPAAASASVWTTPAKLTGRLGSRRGTLEIGPGAVDFRAAKGQSLNLPILDIQSFYIAPHKLKIKGYANRGWWLPGEKAYRFDLQRAVPPDVAAALAASVGKPSQNADPNPGLAGFASIPARHATRTGGTNGVLRFSRSGVAYLTSGRGDSRCWRWADIQTIARPSPYNFRIGGYLETYNFELKQPMSQALFDRLWTAVYGRGLRLSANRERQHSGKERSQ